MRGGEGRVGCTQEIRREILAIPMSMSRAGMAPPDCRTCPRALGFCTPVPIRLGYRLPPGKCHNLGLGSFFLKRAVPCIRLSCPRGWRDRCLHSERGSGCIHCIHQMDLGIPLYPPEEESVNELRTGDITKRLGILMEVF